jgi:sugar phosphate isomerase/epimerase
MRICAGRIDHLHLKDVDPAKLDLPLDRAWEEGIFCPFGEGAVDFAGVLAELDGYAGWTVLEQDRVAVRVEDLPAVRAVEASNLQLVKEW